MLIALIFGKWSVDTILMNGWGVQADFWPALIIGILFCRWLLPVGVVFWLVATAGATVPFFAARAATP
jgi:polyferredoxin